MACGGLRSRRPPRSGRSFRLSGVSACGAGALRGPDGCGRVNMGSVPRAGLGAGTILGGALGSAVRVGAMPWSRRRVETSCGGRVATTARFSIAAGGFAAVPDATVTLAATGFTSSAPRTGESWRASVCSIRRGRSSWCPKRSEETPTTALLTLTFRYTLMLVTLTVVVLLTTTLLTTCGPPQPRHVATPTNPGRPHHGTMGSPQASGAQQTGRTPTRTGPPRNTTRAGAYTGLTTMGPGAHAQ